MPATDRGSVDWRRARTYLDNHQRHNEGVIRVNLKKTAMTLGAAGMLAGGLSGNLAIAAPSTQPARTASTVAADPPCLRYDYVSNAPFGPGYSQVCVEWGDVTQGDVQEEQGRWDRMYKGPLY